MAQARFPMRRIRETLCLKFAVRASNRQIAAATGVSRSTVYECLRRAREAGLCWPLPLTSDEAALLGRLYRRAHWFHLRVPREWSSTDSRAVAACLGLRIN